MPNIPPAQYTPPPSGTPCPDPSVAILARGNVHSVLAIRPGALGDALLAWPALALLRRLASSASLHLASRADVLPLALTSGLVERASAYDDPRWLGLFAPALPLPYEASTADVVVAWLDDPEGEVANRLRAVCRGRVLVAPGRPDLTRAEHAAVQLLRPLASLDLTLPPLQSPADLLPLRPPLDPGERARQQVINWWAAHALDKDAAPVVALHAGSGGAAKRWPAERYGLLAADLAWRGVRPLLLAGPEDAEVCAQVSDAARAAGLAALPIVEFDIPALAALLQRCALLVGNDSGVAHLAALVGIPVLALFGPTDPALWAPLGGHTLRAPDGDLARLPVEEVARVVTALLTNSGSPLPPCGGEIEGGASMGAENGP